VEHLVERACVRSVGFEVAVEEVRHSRLGVVLVIHGSNHASSSRCTDGRSSSRSATPRDQRDL